MKKLVVLLLAAFMLVACGDGGEKKTTEAVKVALLISNKGDMSFGDSAVAGVEKAAAEIKGVEIKVIEYGDETKIESSLLDAADSDYDMIIISSSGATYVDAHSAEFPNKTFIVFDEELSYEGGKNSNVYSIVYKANEGAFLAGYVAAKMSDTGVIGFVGGMDVPVISDFLVGYIEGAKQANPDIKIAWGYTGSWTDAAKGKDLALQMFNQKNASAVFGCAGGSGNGVFEAAVEAKKMAVGVDSDQAIIWAEAGKVDFANVTMTSSLKNVGASLYRAIELFTKGELKVGTVEYLGIKEDGVGLAYNEYYEKLVPADIRAEVESFKERVVKGEITVTSAYGLTTEQINEIRNAVNP